MGSFAQQKWCAGLAALGVLYAAAGCSTGLDGGEMPAVGSTPTDRLGIIETTIRSPTFGSANIFAATGGKALATKDAGVVDVAVPGVPATLSTWDGQVLATTVTDANGVARFEVERSFFDGRDVGVLVTATIDAQIKVAQIEFLRTEETVSACPDSSGTVSLATVKLAAGGATDIGSTDINSTIVADSTLSACGGSLLDPGTPANGAAFGGCAPSALILTLDQVFTGNGTVSADTVVDSGQKALAIIATALKQAVAAVQLPGNSLFEVVRATLAGNSAVLETLKERGALPVDQAAEVTRQVVAAVGSTFDAATTQAMAPTGKWDIAARCFGQAAPKDLLGFANDKGMLRGVFRAAAKKNNVEYLAQRQAISALAELTRQAETGTSFNTDAIHALAANMAWAEVTDGAKTGKAFFNMLKANNTPVEMALLKAQPKVYAGMIEKKWALLAQDNGANIADGFNILAANEVKSGQSADLASVVLCEKDSDCAVGHICNLNYYKCVLPSPPEASGNTIALGDPCMQDSECVSGYCASTFSSLKFCQVKGDDPFKQILLAAGASCSANYQCYSGVCSSGKCADPALGGAGGDLLSFKSETVVAGAASDCPPGEGTGSDDGGTTVSQVDDSNAGGSDSGGGGGTPPAESGGGGGSGGDGGGGGDGGPITLPEGIKMKVGGGGIGIIGGGGIAPPADTTAPTVAGTDPIDAATRIDVSSSVQFTFDEAMDAATITAGTVKLRDGQDQAVAGTVTYLSGTKTARLTPTKKLRYNQSYTARVVGGVNGVKDAAGNPLAADVVRTFKTPPAVTTAVGGSWHTLGLLPNGQLYAWGENVSGQLGDGTQTDRFAPIAVPGMTDVVAVSAGEDHSAALKKDGTVWAWGGNDYGQIGDGTSAPGLLRLSPLQVKGGEQGGPSLTNIVEICVGRYQNLALASDGSLWAWGHNFFGTLGDGTIVARSTPVRVHGVNNIGFFSDVKQISCGSHTSYALKNNGTVWAWGSNVTGRIGDNTITNRSTPTQVHGPGNVGFLASITAIAGAGSHALALKDDGTVWSWGTNGKGQLGDGTATNRWTPVQVKGVDGVGFLSDVATLAGGGLHSWVMKSDGTVFAWGSNSGGQIGDNTSGFGADRATPVQVHGQNNIGFLTDIIGVTSAIVGDQSFAIKDDGTLWGWGRDTSGQMGNGLPLTNVLTPAPIAIP